jgi:hypothetical protein
MSLDNLPFGDRKSNQSKNSIQWANEDACGMTAGGAPSGKMWVDADTWMRIRDHYGIAADPWWTRFPRLVDNPLPFCEWNIPAVTWQLAQHKLLRLHLTL